LKEIQYFTLQCTNTGLLRIKAASALRLSTTASGTEFAYTSYVQPAAQSKLLCGPV